MRVRECIGKVCKRLNKISVFKFNKSYFFKWKFCRKTKVTESFLDRKDNISQNVHIFQYLHCMKEKLKHSMQLIAMFESNWLILSVKDLCVNMSLFWREKKIYIYITWHIHNVLQITAVPCNVTHPPSKNLWLGEQCSSNLGLLWHKSLLPGQSTGTL